MLARTTKCDAAAEYTASQLSWAENGDWKLRSSPSLDTPHDVVAVIALLVG